MALKLYNTLTRTKDELRPVGEANVRMYVCGPTVYDFAHIGNARPVIVFDVLFRLLRHIYGEDHVTYVRNITDVDDKINARAAEDYPAAVERAIAEVTERTAKQFHIEMTALGALAPTLEPRATEYVGQMIAMIETLIATGFAYLAEGHVLFDVGSKPDYGKLSRRSLDEMIAGARVEVAPYKRNAMDFVLWKPSKPGEPSWPTPWGIEARPSRLAYRVLGDERSALGQTFDIHGGGIDLVFPHHENEIAQSKGRSHTIRSPTSGCITAFFRSKARRCPRSLGNFFTIRDLVEGLAGRGVALQHAEDPLPATDGLDLQGLKESAYDLRSWYGDLRERPELAASRATCSMRSATISTRRSRSPSCTSS